MSSTATGRVTRTRGRVAKSKRFEVVLKFTFRPHYGRTDDLEKGEHGYEDESNEEFCARVADWKATDAAYGTDEKIMRHVKKNKAKNFVEYLTDYQITSARWNNDFSMTIRIKTDGTETVEDVENRFHRTSLEDGEYESSGDNGWRIPTLRDSMEYGLTDYRRNPIVVREIKRVRTQTVRRNSRR